jgi:hypothetical protein
LIREREKKEAVPKLALLPKKLIATTLVVSFPLSGGPTDV